MSEQAPISPDAASAMASQDMNVYKEVYEGRMEDEQKFNTAANVAGVLSDSIREVVAEDVSVNGTKLDEHPGSSVSELARQVGQNELAGQLDKATNAMDEAEKSELIAGGVEDAAVLHAKLNYQNNKEAYQQAAVIDVARAGVETSFGQAQQPQAAQSELAKPQ